MARMRDTMIGGGMTNNQECKADGGKLHPRLLFEGMPRALMAVVAVLTYGEQKYAAHSWQGVERFRYVDAKFRHILEACLTGDVADEITQDDESGLLHSAHEITNALFCLEMKLREMTEAEFRSMLKFKEAPQGHKTKAFQEGTIDSMHRTRLT